MAVIGNPNLTTTPVGLGSIVSCAGGNYSDSGIIQAGAKHIAFVVIGTGNVTVTCLTSMTSPNAPQPANWVLPPGLSFNPPITDGCKFPQLEYDATGSTVIIYVEY